MDYAELAVELIHKMRTFHKAKLQKYINENLQGEAFVLDFIARHGDHVLPGEISNEVEVSSARVAAALNSLEDKGLVTRQIDKNDRRKILVSLTKTGKESAEKSQQAMVEKVTNLLLQLGERDAKEYVRIMGRLAEIAYSLKANGGEIL